MSGKQISGDIKNKPIKSVAQLPEENVKERTMPSIFNVGSKITKSKRRRNRKRKSAIERQLKQSVEEISKREYIFAHNAKKLKNIASEIPNRTSLVFQAKKKSSKTCETVRGNVKDNFRQNLIRNNIKNMNCSTMSINNDSDMEVCEEEILAEINNLRKMTDYSKELVINISGCDDALSFLYIVIDTNVLIHDFGFLLELSYGRGFGRNCCIFIPYVAVQELDCLKNKTSIKKAAQRAIKWCYSHFNDESTSVKGQTFDKFVEACLKYGGESGDDRIRDCCMLLSDQQKDVWLLSNDVNLCNKVMLCNISVYTVQKLKILYKSSETYSVVSLDNKPKSLYCKDDVCKNKETLIGIKSVNTNVNCFCYQNPQELYDILKSCILFTLKEIYEYIMKSTYDKLWLEISCRKPPWTLEDILFCWNKHWIAAFMDKFPNDLKNSLQQLKKKLSNFKISTEEICHLGKLITYINTLFKVEPYKKFVKPLTELQSYIKLDRCKVDLNLKTLSTQTFSDMLPINNTAYKSVSSIAEKSHSFVAMDSPSSETFNTVNVNLMQFWKEAREIPPVTVALHDTVELFSSIKGNLFLKDILSQLETCVNLINECLSLL